MAKVSSLKRKGWKRYLLFLGLIVVLLIFRMILPSIVKNYVNNVLANIPGYYGHVEDIDLALYRGAYVIHQLKLNKVNAGSQIPFLNFHQTDISIEWKSLFKGKIVSEIVMTQPKVTYVLEDHNKADTVETNSNDWTEALTELVPISINRLKVIDGKAGIMQLSANPDIDLNFHHINLELTNLRNIVMKEKTLPSELTASATSIGNGKVVLKGKFNLIKEIPDMDIAFSLEKASMTAFNNFTEHYAKISFDEGAFNLYSEVAIADGFLKGYFKPILKNSSLQKHKGDFLKTLWEGLASFFKFVLKNQKKNTLATKVPVEGDLSNPDTKTWPTILNIFKNAWIKAFKNMVDNEIEFKDALKEVTLKPGQNKSN